MPISCSQGCQSSVGTASASSTFSSVWLRRSSGERSGRRGSASSAGAHRGRTSSSNSSGPRPLARGTKRTATSMPLRRRSISSRLAATRTSTPGCCTVKRASRGMSQKDAKPGVQVIATWCAAGAGRARAAASSRRSRLSSTARCMMRPAGVSTSERCPRSNSTAPRLSSSCRICRLTADCERNSSSPASVKLRWRAAASNVCSRSRRSRAERGGVPLAFLGCMRRMRIRRLNPAGRRLSSFPLCIPPPP